MNVEVLITVQNGQVEIQHDNDFDPMFDDAVLIHRRMVENLNATTRKLATVWCHCCCVGCCTSASCLQTRTQDSFILLTFFSLPFPFLIFCFGRAHSMQGKIEHLQQAIQMSQGVRLLEWEHKRLDLYVCHSFRRLCSIVDCFVLFFSLYVCVCVCMCVCVCVLGLFCLRARWRG